MEKKDIKESTKSIRFVLRLPEELYEKVRKLSYDQHKSINRIIVEMLEKKI